MIRVGVKMCSEERSARQLMDDARAAEDTGFHFVAISDHFHPWISAQGQSPFVWSTLGAIAAVTERLLVGTAVTCPTMRIHPAIVAHAAATASTLLPGRFFLGVGTGENLNEHVLGDAWPSGARRRSMLEEAVDVIRELWSGRLVSFDGDFFRVENARLYSVPDDPPPIYVAAGGPAAAKLAARIGDGLIATSPDRDLVSTYEEAEGDGLAMAEMTVLVGDDADRALRTAHQLWPNAAAPGGLTAELPLPQHFEAMASIVRVEDVERSVVVGAEVEPYLDGVRAYVDAGFDHVFFHQIGHDQERFFRFAREDLLPAMRDEFDLVAA